ncbi:MAG TPA: hypothetical protein VFA38_09720, partial [Nitrospirales bacterium]|nr:hypothetical protein [Nitrospirales bacterium]
DAIAILVSRLHAMGYRQMRSRASFRGKTYLGSQEMWIEYPDPDGSRREAAGAHEQLARRTGWISRVLSLFGSKASQ